MTEHTMDATLARELRRLSDRHFLEASMAASALVSLADGELSPEETGALEAVLARAGENRSFDPNEALDLYRSYVTAISDDGGSGKEKAFEAVRRLSGDKGAASALVRVCMAVSRGDGAFSHTEFAVISELCAALDVDLEELGV